jgi:hypothetical protein
MKPITYEEAAKKAYNPTAYMDGYNTAVELANKELSEAKAFAEISYNDGKSDGEMNAKNQILILTNQRDYWMKKCDELTAEIQRPTDMVRCKAAYNPELDPYSPHAKWAGCAANYQTVVSPEMKDLLSKPTTLADLLNPLRERIEKLEQKLIIDEQAQDTLYCDIKELRRKIKKSKSNSWTQTVDNAIDDLMPALSETICDLKLKVESLEKYILPITEAPTAVKVMMQHEQRIEKMEQNAVMDGDKIIVKEGTIFRIITKIK